MNEIINKRLAEYREMAKCNKHEKCPITCDVGIINAFTVSFLESSIKEAYEAGYEKRKEEGREELKDLIARYIEKDRWASLGYGEDEKIITSACDDLDWLLNEAGITTEDIIKSITKL